MLELTDCIGLCGVVLSIYCYGRVQWQRDFAKKIDYSVLNLLASACIFISLTRHWNLASSVGNVSWGLISAYGIYRCLKYSWLQKVENRV